jgi:nitroimidazol reductase NimA-like FMN-containing flavoprotein (pyridoxamine 5'-phosphate oxidase superfamily)
LLQPGGVGRIGLMSADGIVMLPVNYAIAAKTIVFRTAPDTLLAALANASASFETDHVDEASHEGWSILVQGRAHKVAGEREVRSLEQGTRLEPWVAGARDVWVRITPARISGRRIRQA